MAIAEMSVMTLVGLISEKNAILDEMQKCGAAQIRSAKDEDSRFECGYRDGL